MVTLANLHKFIAKGYEVTVVQPSPYHYYSGMGPGMLGNTYSPEEIRFATRHVVEKQGGTFILDKVNLIDPEKRLVSVESGKNLSYDVLSLNIGSSVPRNIIKTETAENIFTVKPIEKLQQARQLILNLGTQKNINVAIIGGGPSAVEIAGNVWGLAHREKLHQVTINIFARTSIMTGFHEKVRYIAINSLKKRKIGIFEQSEVKSINANQVELETGQTLKVDVIFVATGVNPSPVIKESGLETGPEGGLLVNKYLQSIDYPEIFGGGDCIYFQDQPLDKVGVYAVRENPVLLHNLMAALEGQELQAFDPGGDYLLIFNLGDNTGILRKKRILFGGRLAFTIKDYIDRKFMKEFQAIEE